MYKYNHKSALILTAAALLSLTAGCAKRQEKIDLSSSHTTVAAGSETLASEASSTEIALPDTASGSGSASKGGAGSDTITIETSGNKPSGVSSVPIHDYKNQEVSIQYPSVINVDDKTLEAQINETLKSHALSVLDAYEIDEAADTVDIRCKAVSADRSRFTVVYTGIISIKGTVHPVNIFYSDTIDLKTGKSMALKDYADPYTLAGYVLSNDCYFVSADGTLTSDQQSSLMEAKGLMTIDQYTDLFEAADFASSAANTAFPECFSYEDGGSIIFSIPVPHALGDYALVSFTPEGK